MSAIPVAPEFPVSPAPAEAADWSALAADARGNFVVAWLEQEDLGGIADHGVYVRRYSAAGQPLGQATRVDTASTGTSSNPPSVAVDADGDFVVVWESLARTGDDYDVYARRYDAAGTAQGDDFLVNTTLDSEQRVAAVAMDGAGNFVVTWQSFEQDGDGFGVFARRFASSGEPSGDEFQVNTISVNRQHHAAIAMSPAGDFVITWTGFDGGTFPSDTRQNIYARQYAADATPLGDGFRVNRVTAYDQHHASVAMDALGNFVVVWERDSLLVDPANDGIYAQRYDATGLPLSSEIRVSLSADSLVLPAVAMEDDGDFVVVWERTDASNETGVFGRWYIADGLPVGGEFRAGPAVGEDAARPSVAARPGDVFVVAWTASPRGSSETVIFAQQFIPGGSGVNQPPVLAAIGDVSLAEETLLSFSASATDADGHGLTYALEPGSPTGASVDPNTGLFTWSPTEQQGPGSYPVTVRVSDTGLPSLDDTETFTVTVLEINELPELTAISDQTVDEGSLLSFTAIATDPDGNSLTFRLDSDAPAGASVDPATGLFQWTPTEEQGPGIYSLTLRVTDDGVPAFSDSQSFSVTVADANEAPALAAIGDQAVFEGGLLSLTASATDADGDLLAFSLDAGAPAGATIDPVSGVFTWTPAEEDGPGTHAITVRATDNALPALSDTATFSVTVLEINEAPALAAIADQSIPEGILLQFSVLATDPDGNALTYSFGSPAPAGAQIHPITGVFRWTPGLDQGPGLFTITVRVTDDGSPSLSDTATASISVLEVGGTGSQPGDTVGLFAASDSTFYLKSELSPGPADKVFGFGPDGTTWTPLAGDWNDDAADSPGFFAPGSGMFYLKNDHAGGTADLGFRFGPVASGWLPLVGDWDGDGGETVGLYDPVASRFYLTDTNAPGVADRVFRFGPAGAGWTPIAGDWDGDGTSTVGLFDPEYSIFYLTNTHAPGMATVINRYGPVGAGWLPLVGDWNGDGTETNGLFSPQSNTFYLKNTHTGGPADMAIRFGPVHSGWTPLAGTWASPAVSIQSALGQLVAPLLFANVSGMLEATDLSPSDTRSFQPRSSALKSDVTSANFSSDQHVLKSATRDVFGEPRGLSPRFTADSNPLRMTDAMTTETVLDAAFEQWLAEAWERLPISPRAALASEARLVFYRVVTT